MVSFQLKYLDEMAEGFMGIFLLWLMNTWVMAVFVNIDGHCTKLGQHVNESILTGIAQNLVSMSDGSSCEKEFLMVRFSYYQIKR